MSKSCVLLLVVVLHIDFIRTQNLDYNRWMPDKPLSVKPISSNLNITQRIYPFFQSNFESIHLLGGPFDVYLYQNPNVDENYTSIDVITEEYFHSQVIVNFTASNIIIGSTDSRTLSHNQVYIRVMINYYQVKRLHIEGLIHTHCLNTIHADTFHLHDRSSGSVKLKLNVNVLNAYFHSTGYTKICGRVNAVANIQSLALNQVNCRNLLIHSLNVKTSGIGHIYVTVLNGINATLTGLGNIYYRGQLQHTVKTGLGSFIPIDETY